MAIVNDESSRLKQFTWEQLDENLFVAVLFRSNRRYLVQRHFEEQLLDLSSLAIIKKWRRYLSHAISRATSPDYITEREVLLMQEIHRWHLNDRKKNHFRLQANVDYVIDFEDLLDAAAGVRSTTMIDEKQSQEKIFLMEPVTTLHDASRTIAMWKHFQDQNPSRIVEQPTIGKKRTKSPVVPSNHEPIRSSSSSPLLPNGWLQLDNVAIPYLVKHCDRLLPVELLIKERLISSSDEFDLCPWHIAASVDDVRTLNTLTRHPSPLNFAISLHSPLITLEQLLFGLRHLYFVRFITSPDDIDQIDCEKVMLLKGGMLTIVHHRRASGRLPYIFINNQQYIPPVNCDNTSVATFCIATQTELAFLRLMCLYDSLSSDQGDRNFFFLSSTDSISLIPVPYHQRRSMTAISFDEFHYREYQRRKQQNLIRDEEKTYHKPANSNSGWWQSPASASSRPPQQQRDTISHFKMQRPLLF